MGSTWLPKSLRSGLGLEMDQKHICGSYNALPLEARKFMQQRQAATHGEMPCADFLAA